MGFRAGNSPFKNSTLHHIYHRRIYPTQTLGGTLFHVQLGKLGKDRRWDEVCSKRCGHRVIGVKRHAASLSIDEREFPRRSRARKAPVVLSPRRGWPGETNISTSYNVCGCSGSTLTGISINREWKGWTEPRCTATLNRALGR